MQLRATVQVGEDRERKLPSQVKSVQKGCYLYLGIHHSEHRDMPSYEASLYSMCN